MSDTWPQTLEPVTGPFSAERVDGAAWGMGNHGPATVSVAESGFVPPDLMTGFTLFLLARQSRRPRPDGAQKASAIAGGVWVREQVTYHRPIGRTDPFVVTGESTGRYIRKGRRYGTTRSQTHDSAGEPVATNLTTGLLAYKVEDGLDDEVEGLPVEDTPGPDPEWEAAAANPHLDALAGATVGQTLGGEPMTVSLAMMQARDTANPDNPIHSSQEEAEKAGLTAPIAGGSHVQSFALELLMVQWGPEVLLHGALVDCRWRAPTHAGTAIVPTAEVTAVEPDRVEVAIQVDLESGPTAMVGTVVIPLP
ncbi:MAG: MaoC family dehydratase [Actinomycetia bacterium]|nr:MaoC family dehydratase [Actinomycetes bacterium]MCP3912947.1 MaoC family dehydratase [Actinomycetes bacterium]MCP4083640.1 MaoC family dehydratase [Actinomycetes bacterium]